MRPFVLLTIAAAGTYAQDLVPRAEFALAAIVLCAAIEITLRRRSFLALLGIIVIAGIALDLWQPSVHVSRANYSDSDRRICRADDWRAPLQGHDARCRHRVLIDLETFLHRNDCVEIRLLHVTDDLCAIVGTYSSPTRLSWKPSSASHRQRYSVGLCEGILGQTPWHASMISVDDGAWTRSPYIRRTAGHARTAARRTAIPRSEWCVIYAEGSDLPASAADLSLSEFLKNNTGRAIVVAALLKSYQGNVIPREWPSAQDSPLGLF